MTWIKQNLSEMLYFFGYAKVPQDPDNYTGFYDFTAEDRDERIIDMYKGYERHNEEVLDWVSNMSES